MSGSTKNAGALDALDNWLLSAVRKEAAMDSEGTSHPSAQGDAGTQPAQEGARASENEGDVKSQIIAESVNEASEGDVEGAGRGENNPTTEIGTQAAATGEDASVETSSTKPTKEDPGTSHPADTENASIGNGNKYAELEQLGNEVLADIAVAQSVEKQAESQSEEKPAEGEQAAEKQAESQSEEKPAEGEQAAEKQAEGDMYCEKCNAKSQDDCKCPPAEEKSSEAKEPEQAEQPEEAAKAAEAAGEQAAEAVVKDAGLDKQASPEEILTELVKSAAADADRMAEYLVGFTKAAQGEIDPALLAAMAGEEAAAVPPEAAMAEEAAAVPPEAVAEEGAAPDLAAVLAEAGISPEDVLAAVAGGEGAEAAPAEAIPPIPAPAEAEGAPPPIEEAAGEETSESESEAAEAKEEAAEEAEEEKEAQAKMAAAKEAWDKLSEADRAQVILKVVKKAQAEKSAASE